MYLTYTPEQERLRQELRAYFAGLMTPEVRAALTAAEGEYGDGEAYRQVVRQLGRDGWLALSWPGEYGGRGAPLLDHLIFTDEAAIAGVPVPFLTINTVGPTIMRFGTPEQKARYLPRIAAGEIHFSIGYSEPEAGTDLATLRTRAVRVKGDGQAGGDRYVINGQKMWTSLIQYADYVWLACRTDPDAPRHKGLSILIVPTDAPGFSWTPVRTVAGTTTSATYYSDVRVPASALVGVPEFFRIGQIVIERTTMMSGHSPAFVIYGGLLITYYVICSVLTAGTRWLERGIANRTQRLPSPRAVVPEARLQEGV